MEIREKSKRKRDKTMNEMKKCGSKKKNQENYEK